MKKFFLLALFIIATIMSRAQGAMPEFSAGGGDTVWYYIQFKTGQHYLKDPAVSNGVLVTADKSNVDNLKWALIGTKDNFKLVSKKGNSVTFATNRFR